MAMTVSVNGTENSVHMINIRIAVEIQQTKCSFHDQK